MAGFSLDAHAVEHEGGPFLGSQVRLAQLHHVLPALLHPGSIATLAAFRCRTHPAEQSACTKSLQS